MEVMIAIATFSEGIYGRLLQDGICAYAATHSPDRWGDLVIIPGERLLAGALSRYRLDGAIVAIADRKLLRQVRSMRLPVVNVSAMLTRTSLPTVIPDNAAIGQVAARYFLDRGYSQFAYVPTDRRVAYVEQRGSSFASAVREAGYKVWWYGSFPERLPSGAVRIEGTLREWLRRVPKPVAVFASQDSAAADVHATVTAAGLSIPEHVSILGVDNDPNMHFGALGISSVDLPVRQIGSKAAEMLDRMLDGHLFDERERIVRLHPGEIITRASSDASNIGDPEVLEALRYIRQHACNGIRLRDVVDAVPISKRSLQRRFVAATGIGISEEIARVRVHNAKKLLLTTHLRIEEIASDCGFGDRNQFFVAFRAATGRSPRQFRDDHRANA